MAASTSQQFGVLASKERDRAKNAQSQRQSSASKYIFSRTEEFAKNFPKANAVLMIQSGNGSSWLAKGVWGPIAGDQVWALTLTDTIKNAIEQKNDRPTAPLDGLDLTSTAAGARLEPTLQEAQRRGMLGHQQVEYLLDLAKSMAKGVRLSASRSVAGTVLYMRRHP